MKLKKIIIINRAPFEKFKLEFNDENVIVLSGINGTGKTTILSYIVDAFYELANPIFFDEPFAKKNEFYRVSSSIYTLDKEKPSIVYLSFINDDNTRLDYIDLRGKCSKEEYYKLFSLNNSIQYSLIKNSIEQNGFVKYWDLAGIKEIKRREIFFKNILTYFPSYRYELPSYLNKNYGADIKFNLSSFFSGTLPNPIEVVSDISKIANWIMDVILDSYIYNKDGQDYIFVNYLNIILSKILSSKINCNVRLGIGKRHFGLERIAVINKKNKELIYPSIFSMSSGELALLCLFGELIRQADKISNNIGNIPGIVLIDEIDKHLHIKLQKEVLPKLIKFFPNIQFIITSHSPFFNLGLEDENGLNYKIYDLDNKGICCSPQNNELFREVYDIMIKKNEQYMYLYEKLNSEIKKITKPLIITEGKTDWKHIKLAQNKLNITDIDVNFFEFENNMGDEYLLKLLKDYALTKNPNKIIGIFDRDNDSILKELNSNTEKYFYFGNNVYAFAIPCVHEDIYNTNAISIEHYYPKEILTKTDNEGRRLFLGEEFYDSGNSKNKKYQTKTKKTQNKTAINGIIDEKVYSTDDPEQKKSIALSKNDFAEKILTEPNFIENFDFSSFNALFDVIREICKDKKD